MDIHEYQAKELLAGFGVAVPKGGVVYTPDQAVYRAEEIGGARWVVKAQIHSGARGKAGGDQAVHDAEEVRAAATELLGKKLVTHQTGPAGKIVHRLYVEAAVPIKRELYIGLVLDRRAERVCVVAAPEGGMEIEEIARTLARDDSARGDRARRRHAAVPGARALASDSGSAPPR